MIIVGTVMAVVAGTAYPTHLLIFGGASDFFIAYDISLDLNESATDATNPASGTIEYFCNNTEISTSARVDEFLQSSSPENLLRSRIGLTCIYYIVLATVTLIASFTSNLFWNLSAYRQTHRLRKAFFRAIMKQEVGWFDVNHSAQLNSRLSE